MQSTLYGYAGYHHYPNSDHEVSIGTLIKMSDKIAEEFDASPMMIAVTKPSTQKTEYVGQTDVLNQILTRLEKLEIQCK